MKTLLVVEVTAFSHLSYARNLTAFRSHEKADHLEPLRILR
jgi:hypothetical protein